MAPTDVSGAVLASAGLLLQALRSLHAQCQQVRDRPLATLQLHARLHQVFLRVASGARSGSLPSDFELARFTTLLTTFRALIEQHARLRNVLARLLASRRLLAGLVHVHHELDGIIARYDLAAPGSAILEWKTQFATNQQQDEKALHTTMMSLLSTSFLPKEYASERRQALVLMELVCEFAPERERADRHSPHLLETFKMLHKRISNHCGLHLRRVPRWFLPTSEVDFTVKEHTIGHGGSFATTLHRGELFRGGKRSSTLATAIATAGGHRREYMSIAAVTSTSTVAVKCLWVLKDVHFSHIEELLAPFVPLWRLANHPNVVSFQGACHAASPPYLVRNYTTYGNLTSYLTALQSRTNGIPDSNSKMMSLTWQLLYMASRGIIYLHEQRQIVHGGLRCNNILVNKKGHAVVADYGLYAVACEVRSRNLTDHFVKQDADCEEIIRWQAPECLREEEAFRESLASLPDSGPSSQASTVVPPAASSSAFSTDVYAFGMCILEAFTREVPWADLEIAEIRSIKLNLGLLPPRPKHMSSRAWTLIQKMCDPDPAKRITMREVSQELKWFGYGDRRDKKVAIEMKQASSAQSIPTSTESQDSSVGDKENSPAAINEQNSKSRGSSVQEDQVSSRRSSVAEEPRVTSRSSRSSSAPSRPPTKSRASTVDHSSETSHPVEGEVVSRSKRSSSTSSHHRRDSERPRSSAKTEPSRKGSENIWACGVPEKSEVKPSNRYRRSSSSGSLDRSFTTVKAASGQHDKSGSKTTHRSSSTSSASKSRQFSHESDKEQPEHELESAVRARESSTDSRSNRTSRSTSATKIPGQEALALSDEETDGVSSGGSDNGAWAPTSVPAEFMTARSSDIEEETGELEDDHGQPRDELANILDNLKVGSQNEPRLVEDLERLHALLEGTAVERIIQLDGILILLEIVWRGYSARASKLSLEFLLAMITLDPECIPTIVNFEVIKILTAVIKHRPSPEEVEVAATFLLEIIVASDPAKDQFCTSGGVAIVEANDVINRRFVQELKSILAKFKRNEGYKCLDEGEFNMAIEKFSDAITLDRKRSCYYADRSLAYLEASMYKKAAEDAARSMRYNPYDVIGYLRHGLALKAMGRYNEALVSLRKGRQVDPKFTKLVDIIAELESQRSGELHSDARGTRRLTRAEAANAKKKEGDVALRRKEYQLAIAKYTEAIGLDEKNDGIYLHRSIAFAGYGQYGRAIDDASKCIQINYRQIEGYYRLALAFHAAGQRDQALNTLYRGHEIDTTHNGITRLIAQLEEQEAAEAGMTLPLWYKEKGYRAFQLRSYEDAVRFYTKAIDASPAEDDDITQHCYFYRSRANQCRGEFAAVIADCSYLLACNPKNAFARLRRADAYEQQRDYYMALQDIRELVIFNPEYEDAQARLKSLEHRCRLLPEAPGHQAIIDL